MKIEQAIKELDLDAKHAPALSRGWDDSMARTPAGTPEFLDPGHFLPWREYCGLPPDTDQELIAAADTIRGNRALLAVAWHFYYQHQVLCDDSPIKSFDEWPFFRKQMGELAGVFYLLPALAVAPKAVRKYSETNVPPEIVRDTLQEVNCFCSNFRKAHNGRPGIIPNQLAWLRHYVKGRLFRLGRMEYKLAPFSDMPFLGMVLRHKTSGRKMALARAGEKFDGTGLIWREESGRDFWLADFEEKNGVIAGNPVSPYGRALKTRAVFPESEWEKTFSPQDLFIDMHIPAGGNMSPDACKDSMARAFEFFGRFFPSNHKDIVACCSWIFNTDLEEKLPDSNLARFMRELCLFPCPSRGAPGFFFVFCRELGEFASLSEVPRSTRLEKAMVEILESGRLLRNSGMLMFREDLPRFGSQYYRACWDNSAKT